MAATLMRPAPKLEPDEWGAANRTYPPTSGVPGPRDPGLTPYMTPFSRVVASRLYPRVVNVTAAQSGKTETLLDVMGSRLDQQPVPIIYVGPSRDFVKDMFEPRVSALFDEAPSLGAKLLRGQADTKYVKIVSGVKLRLAYAGSTTSLKSDPFGLGLIDEYDEMSANVRGQGDPLGLTEARGDTYADTVTAVISTPSQGRVDTEVCPITGLIYWTKSDEEMVSSPIWRLFDGGTRHHWAWKCPHCERRFIPRSDLLQIAKGATPAQAKRDAFLICGYKDCGEPILEHHKTAMNATGIAIAPGQTVEEAERGVHVESDTWSMWTSGLCSPFKTFGERAQRLVRARLSGNPNKVQTVMNSQFGEVAMPVGESRTPAWEAIMKRVLPYREGEFPAEAIRLFAAVDVQKHSLPFVIRAFGEKGKSWLVRHGELFGPTDQPEVWDDLFALMTGESYGDGMMVEHCFIDSGFRPDKPDGVNVHAVYDFCRRMPYLFTPTKGKDVQSKPFAMSTIDVKPDGTKRLFSIRLAILHTDYFKSLVFARIALELDTPGAWHVHSDIDEDYCRQVTSEERAVVDGKPKWTRRSRNNHFLDCEAMVEACAFSRGVSRLPSGRREDDYDDEEAAPPRPQGGALSERARARAPAHEPEPDPVEEERPRRRDRGSTKDRFAKRGRRLRQ